MNSYFANMPLQIIKEQPTEDATKRESPLKNEIYKINLPTINVLINKSSPLK